MYIGQKEWTAKGRELFGDDKENWLFVCPACGNVEGIVTARRDHQDVKGKGWSPAEECIGRYTTKVNCDWAAYGLFRGPLIVIAEDDGREIPAFDFAGRPFTGKE